MTFGTQDRFVASERRDAVFISPEDTARLDMKNGTLVIVRSETRENLSFIWRTQ
jgi:anaerobic selenocysteine-containing dehydrogenase